METEETEHELPKKPSNTLFNYFSKPSNKSNYIPALEEQKNKNKDLPVKKRSKKNKEKDIVEEKTCDADKENSKKLLVKMKTKKKRKKIEASSSDEDILEQQLMKKKRTKSLSPKSLQVEVPSASEKVVEVPTADVITAEPHVVEEDNENYEPCKVESDEPVMVKPRISISNFFTKVTKGERLSKVEKESSQVEVKVMVHNSPDEKSEVARKVSEKRKISKKPRKSNVARSEAETTKIEVIEVNEVKEDDEEVNTQEVVEIELDSKMCAEEASDKISSKLFSLKRKSKCEKQSVDESDTSVNMESLENTPVKKDILSAALSPVKKSAKVEFDTIKSAFAVLMSKKKENSPTCNDDVIEVNNIKDAALDNESSVNKVFEAKAVDSPEVKITKSVKKSLETGSVSAFTVLMAKKPVPNKTEESLDDILGTHETSVEIVEIENQPEVNKKAEVTNNVFLTLMKNSRKSFEPAPEERIQDEPSTSGENKCTVPEVKNTIIPEDEKLKKMLSVLQAVEAESENDCEVTPAERKERRKSRKKAKSKAKLRKENNTPAFVDPETEQVEGLEDIEIVTATDDVDVYEVRCKRAIGNFHLSKFVSGGIGESILYEDTWMTPSTFEKEAGSRAKKYKSSLFVNNKPIIKLLDEKNVSTPSRSVSRSGRSTPVDERSISPNQTPKRNRQKKTRKIRVIVSDDEEDLPEEKEESEQDDQTKSTSRRRSSGRIARNLVSLQEKRKQQDEEDKAEKEEKKKIKAEEKKRKIEDKLAKKQAKLAKKETKKNKRSPQSSSSESDTESSDCQIEDVIVKKKSSKLASIFTGGKKVVMPAEDPAVTAARRAFLMSSAPEELKSQMSEDKSDPGQDEVGVVWPGNESLASHTQQRQEDRMWTLNLGLENIKMKVDDVCVDIPEVGPGQLEVKEEELKGICLTEGRMSEVEVMVTLDSWAVSGSFNAKRVFNSLVERKVEAESFEREAREKNLSVQEVEDKRLRANRRRSRRSREGRDVGGEGKYTVSSGSGLMWTGKYQPRSVGDMVGNTEELARLREWLRGWVGGRRGSGTGGSTSETGSEWASEISGCEGVREGLSNTALLQGPIGVGKSAAVFALAAEMGFNVLEVNASSCRGGRQVLAMLAEATQSQQVRRETEKGVQGMFSKKEVDKNNSDQKKMKTALILFEDIDLVFGDLDDGFYGAVNTLNQQSKRPIILTVSSSHWLGQGVGGVGEKLLKFSPIVFRLQLVGEDQLVNTLQVLALVEGYKLGKVDIRALVKRCRGVRQCVLQLQLFCESGLVRGGGREISEEAGEQEEEEQVDVRRWFKHIDSKTRRKAVVPDTSGLVGESNNEVEYCHEEWWDSFPGERKGGRVEKYPLKEGEGGKGKFFRIDPLKNKDLFDTENSDEEMEVDAQKESKTEVTRPQIPKTKAKQNSKSLTELSHHLDLVSQFCPLAQSAPWNVLPPLGDSTAQGFPDHREEKGEMDTSLSVKDMLIMSGKLVKSKLDKIDLQMCGLEEQEKYREEVEESQTDVFYQGLVDTFLLDRVGRMDLISGLRGMARGEEHRRVMATSTSRRANRFNHYFSQNEVFVPQKTLNRLCNALEE